MNVIGVSGGVAVIFLFGGGGGGCDWGGWCCCACYAVLCYCCLGERGVDVIWVGGGFWLEGGVLHGH